jgi:hypothetical protein
MEKLLIKFHKWRTINIMERELVRALRKKGVAKSIIQKDRDGMRKVLTKWIEEML